MSADCDYLAAIMMTLVGVAALKGNNLGVKYDEVGF